MAASYEARAFGVRSGMPTSRARRLCADLVIAQPPWDSFAEASRAVFAIFDRYTSVVEPGSMEEAFLDVRARPPRPAERPLRAERTPPAPPPDRPVLAVARDRVDVPTRGPAEYRYEPRLV